VGGSKGQGEGHVPKAQGFKRHSWGPRLCNREGARVGQQTNRQTDKLSAHYSKMDNNNNVARREGGNGEGG